MPTADPRILSLSRRSVNGTLADAAIRHGMLLEKYKRYEVRKINRFLDRKVVPALMRRTDDWIGKGRLLVKEQMFAMNEILRTGLLVAGDLHSQELRNFAITEARWQTAILNKSVPIEFNFRVPSVEVLYTVSQRGFENKTIKEIFTGLASYTSKKVRDEINVGIAGGMAKDEIVSRVKEVSGMMTRSANAVVRTTISDVANATRERVFEENDDVIAKVMLVATLDLRTTEICMDYDGQVFPIDEGPRPPFHWNCRTTVVPVTKSWKELGLSKKEADPGTRASMDGQVPMDLTYEDWLKRQSADRQDEALGPVRAQLFREGKVDISSFVDDGRLLTLEELKQREGLTDEDISW